MTYKAILWVSVFGMVSFLGCGDGGSGADGMSAGGASADGTSSDGGAAAGPPTCAPGEFKISGTLAGETVSLEESAGNYALVNLGEPSFDGSSTEGSSVHLSWTDTIPNDQQTEIAEGSAAFSVTLGGQDEVCASSGTVTILDEGIQYTLGDLTSGSCPGTEPVEGSLAGCAEN